MSIMTDPGYVAKEADLGIYYSTPNAEEICNFVWDTDVPEVTGRWAHHDVDDRDVRSMIAFLTGRPDVTGFLFEKRELEEYEKTMVMPTIGSDEDATLIMRKFR